MRFDASGSSPVDLYEWDFGDGTQGEGVLVEHTYTQPGEYLVLLQIREWSGSASDTRPIFCTEGPQAIFAATPSTCDAPLLVSFDGVPTTPSVGALDSLVIWSGDRQKEYVIQTLVWDFGDGTTEIWENNPLASFFQLFSNALIQSHTYNAPGTYTVTLTVTDVFGLTDSAEHQVVVEGSSPDPDPFEEDLEENFELGAILWELDDEEEEDCIFIDGSVQNDGTVAAGVELTATAYNTIGAPVGTFTYWPAGSTNIGSGVDYAFSFFLCDLSVPGEQVVTVEVVVTDAIVY